MKRLFLGLLGVLVLYIGICGVYGRVWHIQGISVEKSTTVVHGISFQETVWMVDLDREYQAPIWGLLHCGGASSCSSEQRSAIKGLLRLCPLFWFMDIEFSVEGTPMNGHYGG